MKLSEAYERLGLVHPIQHETKVLRESPGILDLRRLGTTTRTLLEMYLDFEQGARCLGFANIHRLRFCYVCLSPDQGRWLRTELNRIHEALQCDVDPAQVQFFPQDGSEELFRGGQRYSWGIYCDHSVKERDGKERTFGPYGFVRQIRRRGGVYTAYDRDNRRVCTLTRQGSDDLIDQATCPITFHPSQGISPITFGAWSRPDLVSAIRMKPAFEL